MKTINATVKSCYECPHLRTALLLVNEFPTPNFLTYCGKAAALESSTYPGQAIETVSRTLTREAIPDWCPLPDQS